MKLDNTMDPRTIQLLIEYIEEKNNENISLDLLKRIRSSLITQSNIKCNFCKTEKQEFLNGTCYDCYMEYID